MINLVVKTPAEDGESFETVCERSYDESSFVVPEPKQLLSIPGDDGEDARYFVENIIHDFQEDQPSLQLIVRTEEEVINEIRQQRAQRRKMQQIQQQAGQGGGNPFGGGGNKGGGNKGGGGSPFTL